MKMIVDLNNILWRAWSVMPEMTSPDGSTVGAVYGLCSMLLKLKREHKITAWMACGDGGGSTWRNMLDSSYKQSGNKMPNALYAQLSYVQDMLCAMGIPLCVVPGWEADDLIGTMIARTRTDDGEMFICSEDIDFYQLVNSRTSILRRSGVIDARAVIERFGVTPSQFVDYKALIGCGADNVPGVPGVGEKTAATLLQLYHILENLLDADAVTEKLSKRVLKARDIIQLYRDRVILNKKLVTISENAPISANVIFGPVNADIHRMHQYFDKMGFKSLHQRL